MHRLGRVPLLLLGFLAIATVTFKVTSRRNHVLDAS